MTPRDVVVLVLQISIVSTVFGFGLNATPADLLYVIRRPGLLARSIISVFLIMPMVAVILVKTFNFQAVVEIVLVALAISPVPPLLPNRQAKAGGHASFGLGLMAILALVAIVAIPATLLILGRVFGRPFAMSPNAVARVMAITTLGPLAAGMAVHLLFPGMSERLEKVVTLTAKVLLLLGVLVLLGGALPAIWALIGNGTVLAFVIFVVLGLAIGHVLGGPNPDHSAVLALSTACRHPALALGIATANFPGQQFAPAILLYLLVNLVVAMPYLKWVRR